MKRADLKSFLDSKVEEYNRPGFIDSDPVSIPHEYEKKQDIEIAGLMASVFAWGQRKTIMNKTREFLKLMGNEPHRFVLEHSEDDLRAFGDFKHVGFFKTSKNSRFSALDTRYYSPLCLLLGILILVLELLS